MATAPAPETTGAPDEPGNGQRPPNASGDGSRGGDDGGSRRPPFRLVRRRNSIWPLLMDLGLVMALFGLIITGRFLIAIGGVLFVVALAGWIREARAEYARLED